MTDLDSKIKTVAEMIRNSSRLVIFTGAGVSTESGIPDFRSPGGIWTRFEPGDFTIEKFLTNENTRRKQWKILVEEGFFSDIKPNKAHIAISELEKMGKLECIITQNIDNLHQKAGNSPRSVLELHGNMQWARCLDCNSLFSMEVIKEMLSRGIEIPECKKCGGMLKPNVVFFGEPLPSKTVEAAAFHSSKSDLFIVIGSSLVVQPASFMPGYAKAAGARLVIINISGTPYDAYADVLIPNMASEAMAGIVEEFKATFQISSRYEG